MRDIDLINEIFFLQELGYNREEIADKLNPILYDMAIDYYTSMDNSDDCVVEKEELLNKIEDKLIHLLVTLQASESLKTQVNILLEYEREML